MSRSQLSFALNGTVVVVDDVHPTSTTLSQWLRQTGRTGTKEGCAEGDCGACTVLVAEMDGAKAPWRSVSSCIALLASMDGREVVTVEGLARGGALHPVQEAMLRHGGSQCGYCTPGFVMAMAEGYHRPELTADGPDACARVCAQLDGNICRCTGYRPIRDAMLEALRARDRPSPDGPITIGRARAQALPSLDVHAPGSARASERFVRPTILKDLLTLRAEHPEARLVGGATEIGVELRKRLAPLPVLLATEGVEELRRIEDTEEAWIVGGAVTLSAFEEQLSRSAPSPVAAGIARMVRVFASRPIRNRATLAGNIATASPIGDLPPLLLALDAVVVLLSVRGERRVAIEDFFVSYRKTALLPDEIVGAIVVPKHGVGARFDTYKVSKRRDLDISIVAAAFRVDVDAQGVVSRARLAFGGVAATPVRARRAETMLVGRAWGSGIDDVRTALEHELAPIDDVRAGKEYRRGLTSSLLTAFWTGAGVPGEVHEDTAFVQEAAWPTPAGSRALLHDSALGHVTGAAQYVDDTAHKRPMLDVWPVTVPHARARVLARDATAARGMPGVVAVLFSEDIPGTNDVGAIRHDEALLAGGASGGEVRFHGHPVALVVADTVDNARRAAAVVVVEVEVLAPLIGIPAALAAGSFHTEPHVIARGDVDAALARASYRLSGSLHIGGQEHFYLETQAAFAERGDDDDMQVSSSTQHPSEVQAAVSHVLNLPRNKVVVTSPRMGGGFGGKETQGNTWAALVALAAWHTRRPVRVQLDRDVDMQLTGKRHPFFARFEVGYADDGRVTALDVNLVSDGGWALDLSESILDRALFHLDNAYHFEDVRLQGRVAATNVTSHTAFRGFGGPQGMLVIEDIMGRIAQRLGLDPSAVRARNFYAPPSAHAGQTTPYGQPVTDHRINAMWTQLHDSARVASRQQEVAAFNATSSHSKRGLAVTPVKFGISFTASFLNQAGALVHIYRDGSIQVSHGGTEMGQGLHAKVQGVVMRALGVGAAAVRVMHTTTDKVPNTSATAASSGADLNGAAVDAACATLRARLLPVAATLLQAQCGVAVEADDVELAHGWARAPSLAEGQVAFAAVVEAAYLRQTSLSSTGYYRTPDIGYDKARGRGKPFHYFAYGVAAAEVEVDGHTGMKRVRRVDILHDVGDSLNPGIDRGQIEGAFIQGMGWLTAEELVWSPDGRLLTHSASTYQVPTLSDVPAVFKVELLPHATQPDVVHGSKAVGEPPLMLALAVREALRCAVAAFGGTDGAGIPAPAEPGRLSGGIALAEPTASYPGDVELPSPVTHEVLFHAVRRRG